VTTSAYSAGVLASSADTDGSGTTGRFRRRWAIGLRRCRFPQLRKQTDEVISPRSSRPGSFNALGALGTVLMLPIGFVLVLVLVLPVLFVLAAIPTDLLAQFGYARAKAVWGTP
jgi:hypothetical protein